MATFKTYFKKEIIESSRQYKYIVLAVGIIGFAILDPFMLKILPYILKNQLPADFSGLFEISQKAAIANYIKDLTQIANIIIAFTLGGMLSDEITSEKLVFPYSKGSQPSGIVIAKIIHYAAAVCIFTFLGFIVAHNYSGVLFEGERVEFIGILIAALLICIYYCFNITLAALFSSLFKRGIAAGFAVIGLNIATSFIKNIKVVGDFMPNKLIDAANAFSFNDVAKAIVFAIICGAIFTFLAIYRMNKVEVI